MDLEKLGDYEFLDLSDIDDENEKQQLKQTLFSQDSNFLQLPWSNDLNTDKWQKEVYASEAAPLHNGPSPENSSTIQQPQHGAVLPETRVEQQQHAPHAQQMQPVTIYSAMPTYTMPPPSTGYQPQNVFVTNVTANVPHTIPHYNVPHYNPEPVDPVGRGHRGRGRPRPNKRNDTVMENTQFAPPYVPMYHYPTYYPQPMGSPIQHPNQHAPASPLYITYATPVYGAYPPYYSPQNTHVNSVMEDAPEIHEMNINAQENHVYQPPVDENYTETQNCNPIVNNIDSKTPYINNNNNIEVDKKTNISSDSVGNVVNCDLKSSEKISVDNTILIHESEPNLNVDNSIVNSHINQKSNLLVSHENANITSQTNATYEKSEKLNQQAKEYIPNNNQQALNSYEQVSNNYEQAPKISEQNVPNMAASTNLAPVSNKTISDSNLSNSTPENKISNNQNMAQNSSINNGETVSYNQTKLKTEKIEVMSSKSPVQNCVSPNLNENNVSQKPVSPISDSVMNNNKEIVENVNVEPSTVSTKGSWASLFSNKTAKNVTETVVNDITNKTNNLAIRNNDTPVKVEERKPRNVERKNTMNQKSVYKNDPASHRMGEFLSKYTLDNRTVSLQPRGLTNRSNYCYINSILQALLACPPFYNLLKALPYQYRKNLSSKSPTPIIDSMVEFVNEFMPLPAGARLNRKEKGQRKDDPMDVPCGPSFEPSWIYKILNGIRSDTFIVEGRQEDAEEFFGCLLNGLNDEMLELMKLVDGGTQNNNKNLSNGDVNANGEQTEDEDEWKVMGPKNKGSITRRAEFDRSPISDIFRGQLRSRVHRTNSRAQDQVTDNVQPFFTLQLDIEKHNSVLEALEALVMKDKLEGVTCSKTKQQVEAWQQVTVEELPLVLVLHLKCFNYKLDVCSKIIKALEFPIELKIDSKLLSTKAKYSGKQKQYKLFAVVYHDGKEASKGHYLTDAFHVGYGGWIRYDDSTVKCVNESQVLHPTAARVPYLLFYRRCDTIGNNQNNNK